ncbi:MAG TPA: hypothetical protein VMI31_05100 [Fimbriimonadaceae bacterium]|nr:hypothetical protein [Fimbriimonadaceae bacterium]
MDSKLSRRSLLAAAASTVAAPVLASVAQGNPPKRLVVGSGDFVYEVHHDWLTPPDDIKWGDTHGLAIDSHHRIYVAHTVNPSSVKPDAVCVFDEKGKFVKSWGSEFKGGAHGLDLRKEDGHELLYHCDINRRLVVKTDLEGNVIWSKGVPMESGVYKDASGWCPTNVAFHPEGDIYVGDGYGSSYVHRYTKDGDYKGVVIGPGTEPGKLRTPHGLWVDTRSGHPRLVVCDRSNHRLQYFTLDGQFESLLMAGMRQPCHFHYKKDLALVPDLDAVVTILDSHDNVVASLCDGRGDPELRGAPRDKFIPGHFVHPHAAIWINDRDILVVEWVPIGRVTLLKKV